MDSAYTSDAIVSCNPINQFHGTAQSCMCEEIQEAPKVLRPLPKPHAHTPHLPLTTAALAAEDSTGAATVHHLQQPTWRTETRSSFAKPSSRDPPTVHPADWPGSHETVAHGATTCAARAARGGRSDRRGTRSILLAPAGSPEPDLGPGGRSPSPLVRVHVGPLTSVRGTPLGSSSSRLASVWEWHSPTARSLHQVRSHKFRRGQPCAKSCADRSESDTWAAIF